MGEETEKPNKVGVVATVSKKHRHRKKLLYQALKKQMEFYFSDVNISKDRFMNNLLQESPYVDLTVFLNFNKIKSMTTKVKDIANALQTSELLKVTEDGTKVFRTTQPQQKENSDECTIYVEQIPVDADHSWLIDIFQAYGPIDYVSIPRYKRSHKNKGFAFVEFKDPDSAKNALATFSEIGCCLSNQMDPGNLCSIRTFQEDDINITNNGKNIESFKQTVSNSEKSNIGSKMEESDLKSDDNVDEFPDKQIKEKSNLGKRKHSNESDNCIDDADSKADDMNNMNVSNKQIKDEVNRRRKRRHSSELNDAHDKKKIKEVRSEELSENEPNGRINEDRLKRKIKLSESNEAGNDLVSESKKVVENDGQEDHEINSPQNNESSHENQELDTKELDGLGEEYEENADEAMEDDSDDRRKKNRRRRKKHKKNRADNSFGLHILSKMEWKSLRNRYLNEQRKKMKELKQYIRHKKYNDNYKPHSDGNFNNVASGNSSNAGEESGERVSQSSLGDVNSGSDIKVQLSNRLTLTPGLIVKVTLSEPVLSKSSFKNEVKIFPEVKYIDVRESSNVVYLRFSSTETAKQCVESGHWSNAEIIKDDEEKAYWDKIAHEREEKLTKGRSIKKGRDKLLKKAEDMHIKHVWFD